MDQKLEFYKNFIYKSIAETKDLKEIETWNACLNIIYNIENKKDLSNFKLKMSTHSGKMEFMKSFSAFQYFNDLCKKYQSKKGMVCANCYVKKFSALYGRLDACLVYNFLLLNYSVLNPADYNELYNIHFFRFEAFGDLYSETHFLNFLKLAKFYKNTNFALWSKNYALILKMIKKYRIPANLNIIISSPLINKDININYINNLLSFNHIKKSNLKIFTVYDESKIKEADGFECQKKCITCLKCYTKNNILKIKEVLKK